MYKFKIPDNIKVKDTIFQVEYNIASVKELSNKINILLGPDYNRVKWLDDIRLLIFEKTNFKDYNLTLEDTKELPINFIIDAFPLILGNALEIDMNEKVDGYIQEFDFEFELIDGQTVKIEKASQIGASKYVNAYPELEIKGQKTPTNKDSLAYCKALANFVKNETSLVSDETIMMKDLFEKAPYIVLKNIMTRLVGDQKKT
jgi:hypothetical protein